MLTADVVAGRWCGQGLVTLNSYTSNEMKHPLTFLYIPAGHRMVKSTILFFLLFKYFFSLCFKVLIAVLNKQRSVFYCKSILIDRLPGC